jgi:hypothetical protein
MEKLNLEPPPAILYIEVEISLLFYFASIFHVLTYTAATSHVAEFSDEEYGAIGHCPHSTFAVELDGLIYLQCFRSYLF